MGTGLSPYVSQNLDVNNFLNNLIIQTDPVDYADIESFAEMVNAVAVSL